MFVKVLQCTVQEYEVKTGKQLKYVLDFECCQLCLAEEVLMSMWLIFPSESLVLQKWRPFCEQYKDKVEDYNIGTLIRQNSKEEFSESNSLLGKD